MGRVSEITEITTRRSVFAVSLERLRPIAASKEAKLKLRPPFERLKS